jgi:hypothetical protein
MSHGVLFSSRGPGGFSGLMGALPACLVLLAILGALPAHAAAYSGGDGSETTPFLISTVQDLLDLSNPANSADWNPNLCGQDPIQWLQRRRSWQ